MSGYAHHKAHAEELLRRTNEKVRKDRFQRDKIKDQAQRTGLSWGTFYEVSLGIVGVLGLLTAIGVFDSLLYHSVSVLRVVMLALLGLAIGLAVLDVWLRDTNLLHYRSTESPQCTASSEPSEESSGPQEPASSGQPQPCTPWQKSWDKGIHMRKTSDTGVDPTG